MLFAWLVGLAIGVANACTLAQPGHSTAEVAAAALAELLPAWEPPAPERLTVLLASLARRDPARYAEVARFIEVMT